MPQFDWAIDIIPAPSGSGRLRGLVVLSDTQESFQIGSGKCVPQLLRFFQNHEPTPPNPDKAMAPLPGPTLRARLGDIVELTFLNQIDPLDYGNSIDRWKNLKSNPSQPGAAAIRARFQQASRRPPTPGRLSSRASSKCAAASSTIRVPTSCTATFWHTRIAA
jgi:hypothetical protein